MDLPYRANVCMLVHTGGPRVWVGRRWGADTWQFPQGGVVQGLTLEQNVRKELEEELGLCDRVVGEVLRLESTHRYDFAEVPERWARKYRGQDQSFWAVEFLGQDSDIRVDGEHPEFSAWKWVTPAQVLEVVEPLRRPGYRAPLAELARLKNWP